MTAFAALTLADGQSTPVNHTFSPMQIAPDGTAWWTDRVTGVAAGYPTVSAYLRQPIGPASAPSRVYRVTLKVTLPVLEVSGGATEDGYEPAPKVAYVVVCNMEFIIPERATEAVRKDALAFARSMLGHAVVTALVKDIEGVF